MLAKSRNRKIKGICHELPPLEGNSRSPIADEEGWPLYPSRSPRKGKEVVTYTMNGMMG